VLFCKHCGKELPSSDADVCTNCGKLVKEQTISTLDGGYRPGRDRSGWWYLLPFFLGIIGGLIAYLVVKDDDKELAKYCLYLGIIMTIVSIIAYVIISVSAFNYMNSF